MSELDNIAPGGIVDLSGSPAPVDDTFDSLFPAIPTQTVAQLPTQGTVQQTQATPVVQQTQQPNEPFVQGTASVYKTKEATIEGLNQKDALIGQLRQRYILATGLDPISGQPVGQATPIEGDNYLSNPSKYLGDLYKAAQTDPKSYASVQQKFVMDALQPLQPIVQQVTRQNALETLAKENPEIPKFVGSTQFAKTLDALPELKMAIEGAERQPFQYGSRLPDLYKIAYLSGQGMQLPDLLKANSAQQSQTTPTPQVRPTTQPTTLSLSTEPATQASFRDIKGIKAYISQQEARGAKLDF